MEKIMVTKEVAEAIEYLRESYEEYRDDSNFIKSHVMCVTSVSEARWGRNVMVLNDVDIVTFAKIVLIGYEVEKTPEEIIKEKYEELSDYEPLDRACKDSFRFVLDTLGIHIEGVNA